MSRVITWHPLVGRRRIRSLSATATPLRERTHQRAASSLSLSPRGGGGVFYRVSRHCCVKEKKKKKDRSASAAWWPVTRRAEKARWAGRDATAGGPPRPCLVPGPTRPQQPGSHTCPPPVSREVVRCARPSVLPLLEGEVKMEIFRRAKHLIPEGKARERQPALAALNPNPVPPPSNTCPRIKIP